MRTCAVHPSAIDASPLGPRLLQLLTAAGCCWLLLAAAGCCWLLLAAAGCCWLLLAAAAVAGWWLGACCWMLAGCWMLASGCCGMLWAAGGCAAGVADSSWMLLAGASCRWLVL